jgi:hypothetical protein
LDFGPTIKFDIVRAPAASPVSALKGHHRRLRPVAQRNRLKGHRDPVTRRYDPVAQRNVSNLKDASALRAWRVMRLQGPTAPAVSQLLIRRIATKLPRFMETSIFVTDLAQQFSLSLVGPSHPVVVPLRVARAGRRGFFDPRSFLPKADMPDMVSGISRHARHGVGYSHLALSRCSKAEWRRENGLDIDFALPGSNSALRPHGE